MHDLHNHDASQYATKALRRIAFPSQCPATRQSSHQRKSGARVIEAYTDNRAACGCPTPSAFENLVIAAEPDASEIVYSIAMIKAT